MLIFHYNALARAQFCIQIVHQQRALIGMVVVKLARVFLGWVLRHREGGPDLAVRMGVGCAHGGALVLKDLHVGNVGARAQFCNLLRPCVDHRADFGVLHFRQGQVMAGVEANDAADARFGLPAKEGALARVATWAVGQKSGEVVVKDKGAAVGGRLVAARALVAGAKIAFGVIGRALLGASLLNLPLPRSLCAVRRHEHPLVCE